MEQLPLSAFRPRPALVTSETLIERPRFPVIDAHNHLGPEFGGGWAHRPIEELLAAMDAAGVELLVDLDGGWGEQILYERLETIKAKAPDRFRMFGGVDWSQWPEQGDRFGEWAAARFREQVARGADGLKIWKPFGLHVRDQHGALVKVDDPRLDPLWATAGELNVPVLIHVADPVAFFDPVDATNERWEELHNHPDWQFTSPPFPPFLDIMEAFARLVERHSGTDFIGAHVGCYAENLGWVGTLLSRCPNFYVDISARLGELGRQPYAARRFFLEHADQILFGIDAGADVATYRTYYRFLETDDEYFNYGRSDPPGQGRWRIYGIFLPDEVLEKVYHRNAERVILRKKE
ncbi:MAG TPA: amidohydrolase family protein [Roseiflexaceae bacterium]|nr:amidohydrolase family protein [Roseiflexaceae bacterium]